MKQLNKKTISTKKLKEQQQEIQLLLVNDILEKIEHLADKTIKNDYKPSYEEARKVRAIKRYADTILMNIS